MKMIFVILLIGLTACAPCRLLNTDTRDSTRIITTERVVERLVRDTVRIEIPAQSEVRTVRDTASRLENDYARSEARINPDGTLYHGLWTKPQTRPTIIDRKETERIRTDTIYINKAKTDVVEVPRDLTWWQRVRLKGFWVLLLIVA
ncbi:MAG: hypothetical protein RRY33_08375, partial [Alistipes sp.]